MTRVPLMKAENLVKSYPQGREELRILRGVSIEIHEGEDICIMGSSGAGKSTLLHLLGTLDRPQSGTLTFRGESLFDKSDEALAGFRNRTMGFVFQFHHLLPEFNAIENVMLPCLIANQSKYEARMRAERILKGLGLEERFKHHPSELSGGEQQRVAIARALVCQPEIIFADEPTGNLDSENSEFIQDLFFDLKKKLGVTLVTVTHDRKFASRFSRLLSLHDGQWQEHS